MRIVRTVAVASVVLVSAAVLSFERLAQSPGQRMTAAAQQFLGSLDDGQKSKVRMPYEDKRRVDWHFVPLDSRKGLPLGEMSDEQRERVRELMTTALSEAGFKKAEMIVRLEQLLQELEGPNRRWPRDWRLYYVTIFGEPTGDGRWGLSFEGHHLSLNFVVENGRVLASTPQFMGANPAIVRTGGAGIERGTRVLRDEEEHAFRLLEQLEGERRRKAIISQEPPREIRGPNDPQPPREPVAGLAAGEMSEEERQTLKKLIDAYASVMPEPVAKERLAAIEEAGFEQVHFAWLGADRPGVGHGYRVQGPTFLIEFVNTQPDAEGNPANHIHCVWRDMRGDFAIPIN